MLFRNAICPGIEANRIYHPHEVGYWEAQRHGFTSILRLEEALRDRDSWAGRYTGRWDAELEEIVVDDDCSDDFDDAHTRALAIALAASTGHARTIIVALGRTDEAAQMILNATLTPG